MDEEVGRCGVGKVEVFEHCLRGGGVGEREGKGKGVSRMNKYPARRAQRSVKGKKREDN